MDFATCNGLDLWFFVEGRAAARKGQPFDPYQPPWWREGFRDWNARNAATSGPTLKPSGARLGTISSATIAA